MTKELEAIIHSLIALGQREGYLPTEEDELADRIQQLVSDEIYISKQEILWTIS